MKYMYYQFMPTIHAITDLERNMLKVSRIKTVNDFFELRPYLRIGKKERSQLWEIRKKIANIYGMVCFTKNWHEPIMWGHYADCNKGIVLGFSISDNFNIKKVNYLKQRKKISLNAETTTFNEYIEATGFIKYEGWAYEEEYRFFVKLDDCKYIHDNYFLEFDKGLHLKEVIIGPEHPYKNNKTYTKTAKYFINLVKQTKANLIVSRAELGGYRIIKCNLWTGKINELLKAEPIVLPTVVKSS